jgi:hypothetical protein
MAYITNLFNSGKQYLLQTLHGPAPKEIFKEILLKLSESTLSPEQCVKTCVESVLQPADCDLSDASRQVIDSHIQHFCEAVEATRYSVAFESSEIKAGFKRELGRAVGEKWAEGMAESFYTITCITEEKEKAVAAQKWTHLYFQGLDYLNRCESEFGTTITGEFVAKHAHMTSTALHTYSHQMIKNRMQTMARCLEKDPAEFERRGKAFEVAFENEPGRCVVDKEMLQFGKDIAGAVTMYWPELEEKKKFLTNCIWRGYTIKSFPGWSILDPAKEGMFNNL